MKIENFEKAKEIKEKIDALKQQLDEVQSAIKDKKEPKEKYFQLINYGSVLLKFKHQNRFQKRRRFFMRNKS